MPRLDQHGEILLFHGTDDFAAEQIMRVGFDRKREIWLTDNPLRASLYGRLRALELLKPRLIEPGIELTLRYSIVGAAVSNYLAGSQKHNYAFPNQRFRNLARNIACIAVFQKINSEDLNPLSYSTDSVTAATVIPSRAITGEYLVQIEQYLKHDFPTADIGIMTTQSLSQDC